MRACPHLNAFTPGTWARVVSGVVWADYAVNEGQVTAKTIRGPLALLSLSGEGENQPRLHAPTPSPLEARTIEINLAPHVLAFVHYEWGENVGWGYPFFKFTNYFYIRRWVNVKDLVMSLTDWSARYDDLRHGRYGACSDEVLGVFDEIRLFRLKGQRYFSCLLEMLAQVRTRYASRFALALRFLQRAAYRAHLARRVRPPARRSRVRRPLHARPRPPTCPAAPPALPAPVC